MDSAKQKNTNQEQSSLSEKFKQKILVFFKSEVLRISFIVFFSIILLVYALPFFFNNSSLKFHIAQKISQVMQANMIIRGNVGVALLPHPAIIIKDVLLQNYKPNQEDSDKRKIYNFYAKGIEIEFPIFSFSSNAPITKIIFSDVAAESFDEKDASSDRKNKVSEIAADFIKNPPIKINDSESGISDKIFPISDIDLLHFSIFNIPEIQIKNGEITIYDAFLRKKEITAINAGFKTDKKKILAQGNFSSENVTSNFNLIAKFNSSASKPDSKLDIISPAMELHIDGNFSSENKGLLLSNFKGRIESEILELKSCYQSYINSADVISAKLKYNAKPIKIGADIESKDGEVLVQNLTINSDLANAAGTINLSFIGLIPLIDINLAFENLDLDSIISKEPVPVAANENQNRQNPPATDEAETLTQNNSAANQQDLNSEDKKEVTKSELIDLNLTKKIRDFDLTAEISAKNIKFFEGEIKDASLYLTISKEGEILILPTIFRIPGDGWLRVNGAVDNSTIVPKFVGELDVSGKALKDVFKWLRIEAQNLKFDNLNEYSIYSDIMITPNDITLDNFYLNLNSDSSEFLGKLKIDNSDKVTNIVGRFQISSFNVDDFFLTSEKNVYLSPGILLKKLFWLNNLSTNNDLSLNFDKLIYQKEEFPEQSLKLRFGRGYFEASDINLKSDLISLKASLVVDISEQNPKFEINVNADKFQYKSTQSDETLANQNMDKKLLDQFFALPSLEGFNGKILFNFTNLKIDDLEINNIKLGGRLKDGNIENTELTCDFYGGNLSYKGLIGIKIDKTINGNLSFNNASLQPLLTDLLGIKNVSGVANFAANLTAIANKKSEFTKQLKSEIKFNANVPSIDGYGLSELVKKMFTPQIYRDELRKPEQILFDPQAKTIFKQASGTIQINNGKDGRIRISTSAPAINAILSGSVMAENSTIDGLFNVIFLTGSKDKQTPINIATSLKGSSDNIMQSTNLDQVKQYLGLPIETKIEAKFDQSEISNSSQSLQQQVAEDYQKEAAKQDSGQQAMEQQITTQGSFSKQPQAIPAAQ